MQESIREKKGFFDSVFESLMERFYGIKFNSSPESSIQYSLELFKLARRSIWITGGHFDSALWNCTQIVDALKNAAREGIDVRIIYGPQTDRKNILFYDLRKDKSIKFHKIEGDLTPQFIVIDENHLRIEETNFNNNNDRNRKAFIVKDSKMLGKRLAMDFKDLWNQSLEISTR